ncbi:Heterokaryon incompatibility [Hyphodiscus hymeniophilus]|uniref:Heterokaryon incompatibility n=1 Tax=Hyphodiscus hymeniophilus TaxID=353542 RepID=A0A9P6VJE5_9HELO|nr:Heterokaryon incompatibility [Hyphodiscus hymeniophilus]
MKRITKSTPGLWHRPSWPRPTTKKSKKRKRVKKLAKTSEVTPEPPDLSSSRPPDKMRPVRPLYEYSPLDPARNEIRLLQLPPLSPSRTWNDAQLAAINNTEATLIHVSLGETPEYEALSYRWSPYNDAALIIIDSYSFWISSTLKSALEQLRVPTKSKLVWVDALCINQKDPEERNDQVSKMRRIYSQATEVIAWLGDSTHFAPGTFSLIQDLYDHIEDSPYVEGVLLDNKNDRQWSELTWILGLEYWKRIWVIQEVNSAPKMTLRYGTQTIDWEVFATVQNKISLSANARTYARGHEINLWQTILNGGPKVLNLPASDDPGPPSLSKVLTFFNSHLSTDPRDMVYALIGVTSARDDPMMQIDYSSSVRQVYISVIDYVLKREVKLDVICGKLTWTSIPNLPSWTPDWASGFLRYFRPMIVRPLGAKSFSASKDLPAQATIDTDRGLLRARGFRLDAVSVLGQPTNLQGTSNFGNMVVAVLGWYEMLEITDDDDDTAGYYEAAFLKTIMCDTDGNDPKLLKRILGAFARIGSNVEVPVPLRLAKHESVLFESVSWVESWMRFACGCLTGRRFFVSEQGLMGLCPENYQDGDIIAVLLGCAVPLLLRPFDEGDFELVGANQIGEFITERYVRFNVNDLGRIAAEAVGAKSCVGVEKYPDGMYNKTLLLTMDNGTQVVWKIPDPHTGKPHSTTASEVAIMDFAGNVLGTPLLFIDSLLNLYGPGAPHRRRIYHPGSVPGIEVERVRPSMKVTDRLPIVQTIACFQKAWISISFGKFSSLYYARDKKERAKDQKERVEKELLHVDANGVDVKNADFAICPSTSRELTE